MLREIFDPFSQVAETKGSETGTGLGLAISRSFARLMAGDIRAESIEGEGSVFYFDLLVDLPDPEEMVQVTQVVKHPCGLLPGQPDFQILIVEDYPQNRLLLRNILKQVGFTVHEAANGQTGLEMFDQWQPDLIWMDMSMPEMDGYEATRRIREKPGGGDVKILAITAAAFSEHRQEILDAGCDDFVLKPYKAHQIFNAMTRHLGVQYEFSNQSGDVRNDGYKPEALRMRLLDLPPSWLETMQHAAVDLDREQLLIMAERVVERDEELSKWLVSLVEDLAFEELWTMLDGIQEGHVDA